MVLFTNIKTNATLVWFKIQRLYKRKMKKRDFNNFWQNKRDRIKRKKFGKQRSSRRNKWPTIKRK